MCIRDRYGLPSGDMIRENLKTMILKATFIDEDERSLLLKIANEYSGSVSYTHLDVYKRQGLERGRNRKITW